MTETTSIGAFAIVPSNNLPGAIPFWERLGFNRTGGADDYLISASVGPPSSLACRRADVR